MKIPCEVWQSHKLWMLVLLCQIARYYHLQCLWRIFTLQNLKRLAQILLINLADCYYTGTIAYSMLLWSQSQTVWQQRPWEHSGYLSCNVWLSEEVLQSYLFSVSSSWCASAVHLLASANSHKLSHLLRSWLHHHWLDTSFMIVKCWRVSFPRLQMYCRVNTQDES